jgi:hypothetical protein
MRFYFYCYSFFKLNGGFNFHLLNYTLNKVISNYIIQLHNELSSAKCNDLLNWKLHCHLNFAP